MTTLEYVQSVLPDGWRAERWGGDRVLVQAHHCIATIDFDRRLFALGGVQRVIESKWCPKKFTGRGWKNNLVTAAIAAVTALEP